MGFTQFSVAILLAGLFAFALINFAMNFAQDNAANFSLANDSDFMAVKSNINNNITQYKTVTDESSTAFAESTLSTASDATEGGSQFKVTPWTSLSIIKNTMDAGWTKIFGSDSNFRIIFTALFAILTFTIIMLAWKAWKGSP
jgi:hypothetical protein